MLVNPDAITVLCFGDSNTYGYRVDPPGRWPPDVRWTGRLQQLLGDGYRVIEEGLGGRTTDLSYPDRIGRNGRDYLWPCLDSHSPVDIVVLMLGTNDLKIQFDRSPAQIVAAVAGLLDDIRANDEEHQPRVVLLSPVHVDHTTSDFAVLSADHYDAASAAKSRELAPLLRELADARGALFGDVATVVTPDTDGLHLDATAHAKIADLVASLITSWGQ